METGLDNANNPFNNSNGSLKNLDVETDNIHLQKANDGLLLNLTDNFRANGTDLTQDIFEKSNGTKKSASDIHFDDEFGPETDVDAVDDAFSPLEKNKTFAECLAKGFNEDLPTEDAKAFSEGIANNNPLDDAFNPFLNRDVEESSKDDGKEGDMQEHGGDNREETPTPPVDTVHDVGGLEENPAESDSEDEWNYFKGDQAKTETLSSQPETVVETSELEDAMSQLNPNAAEFVPVSPTRSIPSPACRTLINDEVIAQSPKRPVPVDIKVPNETEFESEVKSRPSDFDAYSNGHDSDNEHNVSGSEQIENILNGKSIDEIPEFQPGSTPAKLPPAEEFHFGPNAAPFTPRPLDQSEAFSTKANYGDDTEQTLNDSELVVPPKEMGDPMSMSFSAERGESNPFQDNDDLNKVHDLPENLDEFLEKNGDNKENRLLDDTISDLPEHNVLGNLLDNDQAVQTTDLDKISQDDEKELASPLEPDHDDFLDMEGNTNASSKTPDSNLLEGFVIVPEKLLTDDSNISSLPELEPIPSMAESVSAVAELQHGFSELRISPSPEHFDLHPQKVHSISPTPDPLSELSESKSPLPEEVDLLQTHSPLPEQSDSLMSPSPLPDQTDLLKSHSPLPEQSDLLHSNLIIQQETEKVQEVAKMSDLLVEDEQAEKKHSFGELESQGPADEFRSEMKSPLGDFEESKSPACESEPTSDKFETEFDPKSQVEYINLEAKSPDHPEEPAKYPVVACEYSADPIVCELQQHSEAIRPESHSPFDLQLEHKHEEEITSSVKDDISSPIELLSPVKSPELLVDESFEQQEHIQQTETAPVVIEDSFMEQREQIHERVVQEQQEQIFESFMHEKQEHIQESSVQEHHELIHDNNVLEKHELIQESSGQDKQDLIQESSVLDHQEFLQESAVRDQDKPKTEFASEINEQFSIKTDSIKPEFAEPAVITPSEDSKVIDEVSAAPLSEVPVQEQFQSETKLVEPLESSHQVKLTESTELSQETRRELPVLAPLPIVPAVLQETKEVKKEEKKSSTTTSTKKPIGKVAPSKSSSTSKSPATKTTSKPAAGSPRTGVAPRVPSKTGPPKPTAASKTTTTLAATKPLPKPKTATAPKPTERKPLTNGDVKPAPRTTLTKRTPAETVTAKTTTRPASAGAKTSPTKTTAPRPATAPKTALAKSSTGTTASKTGTSTTMAARTKTPLTSRAPATSTSASRLTATTTTKTTTTTGNRLSLSPKTGTTPPKPKTVTYNAPKPRVPLTKTVTKSADVEKEKKESANKLTASRSTTATRTTSGTATSRTLSTTLKKTEVSKPLSQRSAPPKTSSTTTKTTVTKKPGEIKSVSRTKTTKVEKPKENGIAPTTITEEIKEITIVNNVVNDATEDLLKDNSPLDNKLFTETSNALIDVNPAD